MATARRTSGWRGQELNAYCIPVLQDKLLTPDKEEDGHTRCHFFVFLFLLFPISPFYHNVTRVLPLRTIKGKARATSRKEGGETPH
jgi:hypothetical protein